MTVAVAALYRFALIVDREGLRARLREVCEREGIRGTLLIAHEGINGTVAGSDAGLDALLATMRDWPGLADTQAKRAQTETMPFHRLKLRLKREIVTMGVDAIAPTDTATRVDPAEWNALVDDPDTLLIDTRNAYEVAVGSFSGALDPSTASFRDFPAWIDAHKPQLAGKRVAMFCTGGIRCEKATAYLKAAGHAQVFHLDGGILRYLEEVPAADSRWHGECFVFDERVAVGHALAPGSHVLCRACRMPVSAADRASPMFREGVSCPGCHDRRSDEQRMGYAERHRQVALASERGDRHIGG